MINLRYHIVSITAVFLALGIGLTLGSTFLDRVTVDTLKAQLDDVEAQADRTSTENEALGARVQDLEERDAALAAALPERLLDARLAEVPVLVIATEGTDQTVVDAAVAALGAADAAVSGTWWLTDRWSLDDEEEVTDLGRLLDLDTDDVDRLRRNAAIRVAELLAGASEPAPEEPEVTEPTGPDAAPVDPAAPAAPVDPTTTTTVADDPADGAAEPREPALIAAMEETGFLEYQALSGADDASVLLPGAGARYLVISGTPSPDGPQVFAAALLDEIAAEGPVPVVAAQAPVEVSADAGAVSEDTRRTTFVGPIREGELTSERVSTVDDVDTAAGLAALVLAMEDLADRTIGHYGVAPGASTLLPGPVAES